MTPARMRCCWRRRRALPALPFMLRFDILAMVVLQMMVTSDIESYTITSTGDIPHCFRSDRAKGRWSLVGGFGLYCWFSVSVLALLSFQYNSINIMKATNPNH